MGALLGDMTRGSNSARVLYTTRVKRSLAFSSALLPSSQGGNKRGRALLILSALLGAINLSRAGEDLFADALTGHFRTGLHRTSVAGCGAGSSTPAALT